MKVQKYPTERRQVSLAAFLLRTGFAVLVATMLSLTGGVSHAQETTGPGSTAGGAKAALEDLRGQRDEIMGLEAKHEAAWTALDNAYFNDGPGDWDTLEAAEREAAGEVLDADGELAALEADVASAPAKDRKEWYVSEFDLVEERLALEGSPEYTRLSWAYSPSADPAGEIDIEGDYAALLAERQEYVSGELAAAEEELAPEPEPEDGSSDGSAGSSAGADPDYSDPEEAPLEGEDVAGIEGDDPEPDAVADDTGVAYAYGWRGVGFLGLLVGFRSLPVRPFPSSPPPRVALGRSPMSRSPRRSRRRRQSKKRQPPGRLTPARSIVARTAGTARRTGRRSGVSPPTLPTPDPAALRSTPRT